MAIKATSISDTGNQTNDLYRYASDVHRPWRLGLDEKEAILLGRPLDKLTKNSAQFKSRVVVNRLPTMAEESNGRVMAQLPTGVVQALTEEDTGCSRLMELALDRYIIPNAGEGDHLLSLFRLMNGYSKVYGKMIGLVDWVTRGDYTGPNFQIVPIRNVTPEPGKFSINACNYCFVDSYPNASFLEKFVGSPVWNQENLKYVLAKAEEAGHDKKADDVIKSTFFERNTLFLNSGGKGKDGILKLVTKYEAGSDGHWITYCPDFQNVVLRDIPNPHKNGLLPLVEKPCIPLLDNFWGIGDYERGQTIEYALNSILNMHLDGMKMTLFPPYMVNTNLVSAQSTIQMGPGRQWLVNGPNAVQPFIVNPQGIGAFQSTWDVLNAVLLNMQGTTDTAVSADTDPAMGKTPDAIAAQQGRQATRDNVDRYYMEKLIEDVYERFINLLFLKHEKPFFINLFADEVAELRAAYPDDKDLQEHGMYASEKAGRMKVTKAHLSPKGAKFPDDGRAFTYTIDPSSTVKKDQASEHQALTEIILAIQNNPALVPFFKVPDVIKRWAVTGGLEDAEKFVQDPQEKTQDPTQGILKQSPMGLPQAPNPVPSQPMPPMEQPPMEQPHNQFQDQDLGNAARQIHSMGGM